MDSRNISLHTAISCFLWPLGLGLVLVGIFTRHDLGQLGLLLAMIAAVLNVRGFFCRLAHREREAYEIGRESVRPIR